MYAANAADDTSQPPTQPVQLSTQPPDDPCVGIECIPGYHCRVITGQGMCVINPCSVSTWKTRCSQREECYVNATTGLRICLRNPCSLCRWPRHCIFNRTLWEATSWLPKCVEDPCKLVDCLPHQFCVVNRTHQGVCVNCTCAYENNVCVPAADGCHPGDSHCHRYSNCTPALYGK